MKRPCLFPGSVSYTTTPATSYYSESTSESLAATRAFIDRMQALTSTTATTGSTNSPHQTLVHPCITPRFVPTCSKELLEGLAEMAKEQDLDVQSHLSESNDEIAFAQSIWGEDRDDASIFDQVSWAELSNPTTEEGGAVDGCTGSRVDLHLTAQRAC